MNAAVLALRQVGYENRSFWRNPAAAFFTAMFPLIIMVIFNLLFGNEELRIKEGTVNTSTFYVPAISALSIINSCYTGLAMSVSLARDQGQLKRMRGTPLPAWAFLFGKVTHMTLVAIALVAIVTAVGAIFYDVQIPRTTMPAFVSTLALGAAVFSSLGLAVTILIPNTDAAPAVINGTVLPLMFISDVFIPPGQAPEWLIFVADIFPLKHLSEALQATFNPFETGFGFEPTHLAVMTIWGIVGLLIAGRFFSWEPRR